MHTVAGETEGNEGLAVAVALFLVAKVDWKEAQHRLRVQWVIVHRGKVNISSRPALVVTVNLDRLKGAVWALRTACTGYLHKSATAVRLEVGAGKHVPNH
eukprot:scaffold25564_cov74-Phaeocystis_antarctica.AAC.1